MPKMSTVENELRAEIERLTKERDALIQSLWKCWRELNEVRARDGVPWTHQGHPSSVSEEYFSSVVEEAKNCLGDYAKPWPPKWEDKTDE